MTVSKIIINNFTLNLWLCPKPQNEPTRIPTTLVFFFLIPIMQQYERVWVLIRYDDDTTAETFKLADKSSSKF